MHRFQTVFATGFVVAICVSNAVADASRPVAAQGNAFRGPALHNESRIVSAYANLPMSFEANAGQADSGARFLWHGNSCSLLLLSSGAELRLPGETLRWTLVGSKRKPEVSGLDELPGRVNYFVGNDPAQWRTNIRTYRKIRYRDVYPGIDLIYYGKGHQMEYDFVVAPGADPKRLQLAFEGATAIEAGVDGLRLRMRNGEVRLRRPVVYQETPTGRRAVATSYVLEDPQRIAFQLGSYERTRALVIDPVVDFGTYIGGSGDQQANAVAVDKQGNVYLSGTISGSPGLPLVNPLPDSSGWRGSFVAKLNSNGSALLYSTYLGSSSGAAWATGIAVDAAGSAYVTGTVFRNDFPVKNALQANFGGNTDAFVTKLNPSGSTLIYSTYFGGPGFERGNAIAVRENGRRKTILFPRS